MIHSIVNPRATERLRSGLYWNRHSDNSLLTQSPVREIFPSAPKKMTSASSARVKRAIDLVGSSLGLISLVPFVPIVGTFIKLESPGPVFVRLPRVSRGKIVHIYKFRSMIDGAHRMRPSLMSLNERSDGVFFKIKNDPRLTRVGKVLRKFRIDEFPQLWNVFKGELSLVGPRPHEPEEVTHYPGPYRHLILEKAGVTGLSQIHGASSLPFRKELEFDSHYAQHRNLWMDIKIIGKTVKILFSDPTAV